jgi:hypothetical protein
MPQLTTRALKCIVVLDPVEIEAIDPGVVARVIFNIRLADGSRTVTADIAAKSLRKVQAAIAEHGPDGIAVIIQGKLGRGDVLLECGMVAQIKAKPAANPVPADAVAPA